MCLIGLSWRVREDYPLILAANRDEFFTRPAAAAHYWHDHREILAGRDLEQGGTWLGLTRSGRVAAVTNFRDGTRSRSGQRSRGWLVRDYLLSDLDALAFLQRVDDGATQYDGFNLLAGTHKQLFHYSNRTGAVTPLGPGVHGLSNHLLNTPWPKVARARETLLGLTDVPARDLPEALFALLADRSQPPDEALPDTGIGLDRERVLSTVFIQSQDYGTRCSTVLLIDRTGRACLEERSFAPDSTLIARRCYTVKLPDPAP
jgi:uncharacterized protein with NRDE domain